MSLKDLGKPRLDDKTVKNACFAYLATLPESEWGQMQEAARRIYGNPGVEGSTYWGWGTFEFQAVYKAFHELEKEGVARYGSHLGWKLR